MYDCGETWSYACTDECSVGPSVSGSVKGGGVLALATIILGIVAVNSSFVAEEVRPSVSLSTASIVDWLVESC